MALVRMKDLLDKAHKEKYGIGAFNVANMEMIMGAIKAAEEVNSPIILQIAEARLKHSPLELLGPMMVSAAKGAKVPVAVHLDHGLTRETIQKALEYGFTSVMIDGSKLSLEENIKLSREIVEIAKEYEANVEAEIGVVGGSEDGSEDNEIKYTDVIEAIRLANESKIDAIAIAIGNAHGMYKSAPKLNFDILERVNEGLPNTRIVLHGGSGISEEDFRTAIKKGMIKINVATATFISVFDNVKEGYEKNKLNSYFDINEAEVQGAYENVKRHIGIFQSENRGS